MRADSSNVLNLCTHIRGKNYNLILRSRNRILPRMITLYFDFRRTLNNFTRISFRPMKLTTDEHYAQKNNDPYCWRRKIEKSANYILNYAHVRWRVAVCGCAVQCVAVPIQTAAKAAEAMPRLQLCDVLQCIAVWCSVLQCGAVWCSVLQRNFRRRHRPCRGSRDDLITFVCMFTTAFKLYGCFCTYSTKAWCFRDKKRTLQEEKLLVSGRVQERKHCTCTADQPCRMLWIGTTGTVYETCLGTSPSP